MDCAQAVFLDFFDIYSEYFLKYTECMSFRDSHVKIQVILYSSQKNT